MIILIDQDGPLADYESGFSEIWKNQYPDEFFLPLSERHSMIIEDDYPEHLRDKIVSIQNEPNFYLNLKLISGSVDAIKIMLDLGHDVRICTAPARYYENCVLEKFQWVEKHLGRDFTKRIILTRDKTLIRGQLLIDDKPLVEGICKPEWEHILYDYPYNRQVAGKRRLDWGNWREVLGI